MQYKSIFSQQNVLIVDDDSIIRQTIKSILEQHGVLHIFEAGSAEDVYTLLEKEEMDAILLDINMPQTNGIEVCSYIRSQEKYNLIPIIMITSQKSHEVLNESLNAGANDFIEKPVTELELISRLDSQLHQKGMELNLIKRSRHHAQDELISMLAHHWRQPLMHIASLSSNIQTKISLDMFTIDDLQDTLKNVDKAVNNLSELIDSFNMTLSHKTEKEIVSLASIIENLYLLINPYFDKYNISFEKNISTDNLFEIDQHSLLQVLFSIISNSIEALRLDAIKDPKIGLTLVYQEEQLIITVEDNGKGIKKEDIDYIFEPYFSTKKELNGTGLGLYRSKQIIERNLNGTIKMDSDGSKTQTFLTLAIKPYAK